MDQVTDKVLKQVMNQVADEMMDQVMDQVLSQVLYRGVFLRPVYGRGGIGSVWNRTEPNRTETGLVQALIKARSVRFGSKEFMSLTFILLHCSNS
jgi:hypothetical protein